MLDFWLMSHFQKRCLLGLLSALLLNLPFPIAGPVPAWRTLFAFFGASPLIYALLSRESLEAPHYLWKSFLVSWIAGIAWYGFNCYWIYQTMYLYGGLPSAVSAGILVLFSLILGLYFGLFGWAVSFLRQTFGKPSSPACRSFPLGGDGSAGFRLYESAVGSTGLLTGG